VKLDARDRDVLVIGGGPGGTTAAALLAKEGRDVLLVEKNAFPRFHIGESLLPGSWPLWKKLGVDGQMAESDQLVKQGAMFNLFNRREFFYGLAVEAPEYFPDNDGRLNAFQVIRSEYDQMMLDNARRLGAEILQPATVKSVTFEGSQATGAVIVDESGESTTVNAKVIVDATGRDSLLARKLGLRHPDPKLNKISYYTHFRGAWRARPSELPTWILAFEGGWVWYISLRDDLTSVGVVVDVEYASSRAGRDLQAFYRETLSKVPYMDEWLANAEQVEDLHAVSAISYLTDYYAGDGWLLVGDSASFVDPIFSSGVHLAMVGGDLATQTIGRAFETGDFSAATLMEYDRALRRPMNVIFPIIQRWYNLLRNKDEAEDFLYTASRFSLIRKRLNATFAGAYIEAGEKHFLDSSRD
jgi:halogenation protein CepH